MTLFAAAESIVIDVADLSMVGVARRAATDLAGALDFAPNQQGNLAIVVTEAATNLAQHARGGRLLIQAIRRDQVDWISIIAVDNGPGITDVSAAMRDGYSTAGTRGQGLGAISRLSDYFDIYSAPGVGTALLARVCARPVARTKPGAGELLVGVVDVPMPGEKYSGDSWAVRTGPARSLCMVVDGLGHGPQAADAALNARRVFLDNAFRDILEILDRAHGSMRKTRGAAMAIAEVLIDQRVVRFAGVGNISGTVWSAGTARSMVSYAGIVGHEIRKVQDFSYPFPEGSLLIMYSDGLTSHCAPDGHTAALNRHPALMAAMLYRDCVRGRDDATILVAREP